MKIKNITLSASAMLLGASLLVPGVLAAAPYDMEYSGGEPLDDSNVTIDPELINSLTPLITGSGNTVSFSDSAQWKDAWLDDGHWDYDRDEYVPNCVATKYLLYGGDFDNDNGDVYFTVSNDSYSVRVQVDDITTTIPWIDASNLGGLSFNLSYNVDTGGRISFMDASGFMFSDSSCSNPIYLATPDGDGRVYVQTKLKLSKNNGEPFYSDELFLGVDLDLERSFMVLNSDNLLTKSNMYAKSTYALQPYNGASKYVDSNKYIYSYDPDIDPDIEPDTSYTSDPDVFVKISQSAQDDGIDVVHGFSYHFPYSNILFYAREYMVTYASDENGEITGIADEKVFSGNNPTGSVSAPKEGYKVEYWTADKNVILEDGTEVSAGEHLTTEQVKEVRVNSDLTFTAHHGELPAPDPGPGPDPEPEPEPEPEPDPEPKPEPKPDPEVEPEEEEEPEIPVPNTSSPDTGAYTNDAGFITLGLAGSIVAGVTLALVGLAIKSKRN